MSKKHASNEKENIQEFSKCNISFTDINGKRKRIKLENGKFYYSYGGKPHPALIFETDKKHKTFKSIRFGTTKRKHMTKIHPIQKGIKDSYVKNRPFIGTRNDYGDKELNGLCVDLRDEIIVERIKKNNPEYSRRAKERYK